MKKNANKGFSIVEMIIYLGLLSIFLVFLMEMFLGILKVKSESESTSALNQDMKFIFSRLNYDLLGADSVSVPANLGDETNVLEFVSGGVTYSYGQQSGNFVLLPGTGDVRLNSSDTTVETIVFKRIGSEAGKPTIRVVITLKDKWQGEGGGRERTFTTTLGLR